MRKIRHLSVLFVLVTVLSGCGGDAKVSLDPPDIEYGVDMSEMGMPEGKTEWLLFDDIGEFLKYTQIVSDDFEVVWIPDHDTEEWIRGEDAWFVQANEYCYSPMKWCVAAFGSEDAARNAHLLHGGEIWSWDTVQEATWDSAPAPYELED